MFTGIIEETGIIKSVKKLDQGALITVTCSQILNDVSIGDSIAVDGACQTVVRFDKTSFQVEASLETLNLTTFNQLHDGEAVNLERAMPANGRFGGHIVSGHVDGVGTFKEKVNQGIATIYYFSAPDEVLKYMVYKGSICVNGISLTIASLKNNIFSISVIPITINSTNLKYLSPGDKVNLESDILAKYIEKFTSGANNSTEKITVNYLEEHGFI